MSNKTNPSLIPTRVHEIMGEATRSVEGVIADFLTPILPNIGGKLTREGLINLNRLISENEASVASNLRRGRHGHLTLTMTSAE